MSEEGAYIIAHCQKRNGPCVYLSNGGPTIKFISGAFSSMKEAEKELQWISDGSKCTTP